MKALPIIKRNNFSFPCLAQIIETDYGQGLIVCFTEKNWGFIFDISKCVNSMYYRLQQKVVCEPITNKKVWQILDTEKTLSLTKWKSLSEFLHECGY